MEVDSHDLDEKILEERLKIAVHYAVNRRCEDVSKEESVENFTPTFVASLTECIFAISKEWSSDLEAFAKYTLYTAHAKRSTITFDDLKLLTRKNPDLQKIIQKHLDRKYESTKIDGKELPKKRAMRRNAKAAMEERDENSRITIDDADTRPDTMDNDGKAKSDKFEAQDDKNMLLDFESVQNYNEDLDLFDN